MIAWFVAPFEHFSSAELLAILVGAEFIFLIVRPLMSTDHVGLRSSGTGIMQSKFAGSPITAEQIEQGLNLTRRQLAKQDLLVDVLFVVAYTAGLAAIVSSTIAAVIDKSWPWFGTVARVAAWIPLVAGGCGLVEEWFLWITIRRLETTTPEQQSSAPRIAKKFALFKFWLLGISIAWLTLVTLPLLAAP